MKKIIFIVCVALLCVSCDFIRKKQLGDAVVKIGNETLYQSDIDAVTASAATYADSVEMANAYIRQWAIDVLSFDKAHRTVTNAKQIESRVADYRRQLYLNQYENQLIEQRMPKYVNADSVAAYYESYKQQFLLGENIVHGIYISVPNDAPDMDKLKQQMLDLNEDNLELIEKYVWQYANGYQLFTDYWQNWNTILMRLPESALHKPLLKSNAPLIELADSTTTYLVRLTDKLLVGETMPLEYATPKIEEIILARRKLLFIKQQETDLLESALRQGKLIINNNNSEILIQ